MRRPSELLRQMIRDMEDGLRPESRREYARRPDAMVELGRWLDQLDAQTDVTSQTIGAGGAPIDAAYITLGNNAALTAERALLHDATLTHTDGGPNGAYTLGVTPNGHRHREENIDESRYRVVDQNGLGDHTTVQAAIDYMDTNSVAGTHWTVLVRNGVYQERPTFATDATHAYGVTFVGLGNVVIEAPATTYIVTLTAYADPVEFRNIDFRNSGIATAWEMLYMGNGNDVIFRDCAFRPLSEFFMAGNFEATFYHCTLIGAARFIFSGSLTATFWDCTFSSSPGGGSSVVYAIGGNNLVLRHCLILNGGAGYDLYQVGGALSVGRCLYNTNNTSGTIVIIDGDVPAPDANSVTLAALAMLPPLTVIGNDHPTSTLTPQALTAAELRTLIDLLPYTLGLVVTSDGEVVVDDGSVVWSA